MRSGTFLTDIPFGDAHSLAQYDTLGENRRTTIIGLGDGRSNHGNPRTDLFRSFAARAKRTIWLNPEPQPAWGTGDSEIPRYRPYCSSMSQVSTLKDLERAVDDVLSAYA